MLMKIQVGFRPLFVLGLVAYLAILFPVNASGGRPNKQDIEDYYATLHQQLNDEYGLPPGLWIFGETEAENLALFGYYGRGLSMEPVAVEGMPFSTAMRLTMTQRHPSPWNAGGNLFSQRDLQAGDVVLLVFWMRALDAEAGEGFVRVTLEDSRDNEPSLQHSYALSDQWQQFFAPATIIQDEALGQLRLSFHVGAMMQTVEIGGVAVIHYGNQVELADLPKSIATQYPGRAEDAAWRAEADQRIEKRRKGDLTIIVQDREGTPLPGADLQVEMTQHLFEFGSAFSVWQLLGNDEDSVIYREKIINLDGSGHGFNSGTMEWSLQWIPWTEGNGPYTQSDILGAVQWVAENISNIRGHSIIWGEWRWLPQVALANRNNPTALLQQVDERIHTALTHPQLAEIVREWDVVNEPRTSTELADALINTKGFTNRRDVFAYIFQKALESDPTAAFYLNDFSHLSWGGLAVGSHQHLRRIITDIEAEGGRIDGIGLQSHLRYPLGDPAQLYSVIDDYASMDKKIRITELDIEIEEEETAATYTRDFLTIVFSHPDVVGIQVWNIWDSTHWLDNALFFREDWSLKPAGQAYIDLVFDEWWTDEAAITDAQGSTQLRGFRGDYAITASYSNISQTVPARLTQDNLTVTIALDTVAPGPAVAEIRTTIELTKSPQMTATRAVGSIWQNAWRNELTNVVVDNPSTDPPSGTTEPSVDFAATWQALHDEDFLYALVTVQDNFLVNDSGDAWWDDDSVELFLDTDLSRATEYDGQNDHQLIFRVHDEEIYSGPNSRPVPAGTQRRVVEKAFGYQMVITIPITSLVPSSVGSASGEPIQLGLDIQVNDDDDGGARDSKLAWSAAVDDAWQNPTLFGIVELANPSQPLEHIRIPWIYHLPSE